MVPQKKLGLKHCIKCAVELTDSNWLSYLRPRSNYICTPCFRNYGKQYHKSDPDYNKKQLAKYHSTKHAIILSYGDMCTLCGEDDYHKLTIDHKFGGGNAHRKVLTNDIYQWLYNNPIQRDGYQILCYNCNCSKNVVYKDKYALRDKQKVMVAYGGQCAECNEDRIERLTIDHKNNDGAQQRRDLKCYTGVRMYRWLIKNNYPQHLGLQVLCYNCNCSKISKIKSSQESEH